MSDVRDDDGWEKGCLDFHGRVLVGERCHWRFDWDGEPVDDTCAEAFACNRYDDGPTPRTEAELTAMRALHPMPEVNDDAF